jgi:hypothetical protein
LHESSPLLFWTIVVVSSRQYSSQDPLYKKLVPSYQSLLYKRLAEAIHTVQDLHAIILICLWPLPVMSQPDDPSWNYIGLAINAAMQMGLHKPRCQQGLYGFGRTNAPQVSVEVKMMTWMTLFELNARYVILSHQILFIF